MDVGVRPSLGSPDNEVSHPVDEKITLSDVIACIQTDLNSPEHQVASQSQSTQIKNIEEENPARMHPHDMEKPYVRIIEQPASKALRFRYQCEGRSAGSIPGVNSTSDVKTYPAIQVIGYKGPAVVLVSCVTKDAPYRPHPHNLVGREGCNKGVCTLEIPQDTMSITFSNLGIQCVKKKDIGEHLDERKAYKVDPFGTGFQHKNQPTSIDLNVVRLCFQVFIPNVNKGDKKYSVPLTPVVSDPIYDKKAMCDLTIVKLSDCVSTVDGGRKDIILLCEKVTKEDIEVRFYEEHEGHVMWEAKGDFQPSQVHKQTAIWFRAPKYRTLDITEPVRVCIQLRRPSDGATSEPLPFEMLPLDSGRPAFWSIRRNYKKSSAYDLFNSALATDAETIRKRQLNNLANLVAGVENASNNNKPEPEYGEIKKTKLSTPQITKVENDSKSTNQQTVEVDIEMTDNYEPVGNTSNDILMCNVEDDVLKCTEEDVIREVVELDEIYSDNQKRIEMIDQQNQLEPPLAESSLEAQESFDDAKTYSSLQMAFKNPMRIIDIDFNDKYEDIIVPNSPLIDVTKLPQEMALFENEKPPSPNLIPESELIEEPLPPLPPKRTRKVIETDIDDPGSGNGNHQTVETIPLSSQEAVNVLCSTSTTPISLSRSHSMLSRSQNDLAPEKRLPPKPTSTLPNPKKRGFFSKLFGRKQVESAPQSKRCSLTTSGNLKVSNVSLNRTPSNMSNRSNLSYRIPLKDSNTDLNDLNVSNIDIGRKDELQELNINNLNNNRDSVSRLNEDDDLNMNLDLTEAEHYALYTAMAPHATQSEFDEMSAYYAPVEGGKLLLHQVNNPNGT